MMKKSFILFFVIVVCCLVSSEILEAQALCYRRTYASQSRHSKTLSSLLDLEKFIACCVSFTHRPLVEKDFFQSRFAPVFDRLRAAGQKELVGSSKESLKNLRNDMAGLLVYMDFENRVARLGRCNRVLTGNPCVKRLLANSSCIDFEPLVTEFILMYIKRMRGISHNCSLIDHYSEHLDDFFTGHNSFFHLLASDSQNCIVMALLRYEKSDFVRDVVAQSWLDQEAKERLFELIARYDTVTGLEVRAEDRLPIFKSKKE